MNRIRFEFEILYDLFGRQLYTCALAIVRRKDLAEDAVHNVFSKLFTIDKTPDNLKVYVFQCVRNAAIDIVRKEKLYSTNEDRLIFDPSPNPRESAQGAEFLDRAAKALNDLADDERETIVQHLYADLTFREISELREISINTVMSWYRRGMEKLRNKLEDRDGFAGKEA